MTASNASTPGIARGEIDLPNWLTPGSLILPEQIVQSAWLEHGAFSQWIIEAARPRVLVELGTHNGYSYLAFCEAIQRLGLDTSCFALDTWEGDAHAGFYSEAVFDSVTAKTAKYPFSTMLRGFFSDQVDKFEDASIDLLHIDGRHLYEDVREDFELYRPKLSDRSIVLFHDTMVRERDFGVWKLWEEVSGAHPSFNFEHGNGLGVLMTGTAQPPAILEFLEAAKLRTDEIRSSYSTLGEHATRVYSFIEELVLRDREIESLKTKVHLLDVENSGLRQSTSWRVTAPLRKVSEALHPARKNS